MEKENKQNFIELPLHAFKKKIYPIPPFLLQSKLQRTSKNLQQLKKIIEAQQYVCVSVISEERNIFCVKLESNDKLGIIEVKEASSKNRCIYVSLNLNSSLKKEIRPYFLMKNWKIQNKIYIEDDRGAGIALLEYNFAQMDLRNFINKQQGLGNKLSEQIIRKMAKDLLENLCFYHLQQTILLDIRPQTILYENGRWFILNGDYAMKAVNEFGSSLSRPINAKFTDKRYLSPLILENHLKNDSNIIHNPYKSDVYSLGLVLLELFTLGVIEKYEFRQMLQTRRGLKEALNLFEFSFRQKFLLIGQKKMKIPNLLKEILAQKQQNRSYIFEVCFMLNFMNELLSKILPPFEQFFKKEVIEQIVSTRKRIIYSQCPIEYEGEVNAQILQERDEFVRQGRGVMYYNGQRIFDGQWHHNIPTGKCSIQFSQLLSYEGHMENGLLHGQGVLSFNGGRIGQSRWFKGLSEEKSQNLYASEQIQGGYYVFKEQKVKSANQLLVYFYKLNENLSRYVLNLIDVPINKKTLKVIHKILENVTVKKIVIQGITKNFQYFSSEFQLGRLQIVNCKNQQFWIQILTGKNALLSSLQKILSQTLLRMVNLEFDCRANSHFSEQAFRDLISATPNINILNLSGCRQISDFSLRYICQHANCAGLKKLYLDELEITDKSLVDILFSPIINQLQTISMSNCTKFTSQKVAEFFSHQKTFELKSINISGVHIDHHGFQKILTNHDFKNLEEFNVGMCHKISEKMMTEFIKKTSISKLRKFFLFSTTFKDPILELLSSNNTILDSITAIDFSGCINFTPLGFSKYLMSENVMELSSLNLSGTEITDQLLQLLSKKSFITNKLEQLSLSCCYAITDKGIKDFLRPDKFTSLKKLNLSRNNFSNDSLFVLSEVTSRQLTSVNLSKCSKINDLGVEKFLNSQNVKSLFELDLSGTGVKETSFTILTTSKYTNSLKKLNFSDCRYIEESALVQFTSSHLVANLESLDLNNTFITEKTINSFNNNSFLMHKNLKISVNGCRNITENMLQRLCFIKRISYENENSQSLIIKNGPKDFSQSSLLHKLSELQINKKQIKHLEKIFQSDYAINLSKINLNWIKIDLCLEKMSKNLSLQNIKFLNLAGSSFNEEPFQNILKSTIIKQVQHLDLSWTECSNYVLFAMADSNHLNNIRTLKLARCHRVNDKGFQRYFSTSKITTLTTLDLRSTLITNATLESLFTSKYLKNLSNLCLRSCQNIKDSGFAQYFKNGNCSILKDFDISWTKINGQIFSFMANSKKLNQLYTLRISGLKGIQFELGKFIESSSASSLTSLQMNYCEITSKIMHSISSSRYLNSLEDLEVKGYSLDDLSVSALSGMIRSSNTSKLRSLMFAKGKNQSLQKVFTYFQHYIGKIENLTILGLTDGELERWRRTFQKCTIDRNDSLETN